MVIVLCLLVEKLFESTLNNHRNEHPYGQSEDEPLRKEFQDVIPELLLTHVKTNSNS